jgi:hypothetical protein
MTGAAGALNAEAVDVTTANRAAVAVVVFMVVLLCVELCSGDVLRSKLSQLVLPPHGVSIFLGENCQLSESNFLGAESWR